MTADELRAAFWAALPAALPPGARVEPPTKRGDTVGRILWDDPAGDVVVYVDACKNGRTKIQFSVYPSREWYKAAFTSTDEPAKVAVEAAALAYEMSKAVRVRRDVAAAWAQQRARAAALAATSGADGVGRLRVGVRAIEGGGYMIAPLVEMTAEQVQSTLDHWRAIGVLS